MNTKAESLCENLQYQILSWLPPKSLIRFGSVSKSWYSTIHDPSFIIKHTENQSRNDDNRSILVIPKTKTRSPLISRFYSGKTCEIRSTLALPFTPSRRLDFVGSCNGLICLYDQLKHRDFRLYIWNPSIRTFKLLPPPSDSLRNTSSNFSTFGIGFCSLSNDYRVLRLTYYYQGRYEGHNLVRTEAEVYSLSTDSWRMVKLDGQVRETCMSSVSVNGYIYWLATDKTILSYNTGNDLFEEIIHPSGSGSGSGSDSRSYLVNYHIAVVRGRLCVLIAQYEFGPSTSDGGGELEIWMMREHGVYESWTKLWNIRQGEETSATYGMTVKGEILQFTGFDYRNLCLFDRENLGYYDVYKGSIILAASYMESLVLLDTQKEPRMKKKKKRKFNNM